MESITKVKIGEGFDLEGEPAILELIEHIDLSNGERYYVLKLDLIGRFPNLRFSKKEVDKKNLKFIPLNQEGGKGIKPEGKWKKNLI